MAHTPVVSRDRDCDIITFTERDARIATARPRIIGLLGRWATDQIGFAGPTVEITG